MQYSDVSGFERHIEVRVEGYFCSVKLGKMTVVYRWRLTDGDAGVACGVTRRHGEAVQVSAAVASLMRKNADRAEARAAVVRQMKEKTDRANATGLWSQGSLFAED